MVNHKVKWGCWDVTSNQEPGVACWSVHGQTIFAEQALYSERTQTLPSHRVTWASILTAAHTVTGLPIAPLRTSWGDTRWRINSLTDALLPYGSHCGNFSDVKHNRGNKCSQGEGFTIHSLFPFGISSIDCPNLTGLVSNSDMNQLAV